MWYIFNKEIRLFFSSLIGYIVIGVFLMILGLTMFVFPDFSMLEYAYASLDQLFNIAPIVFIFLIPAITMRSFAEENQAGTIELLLTKPISDFSIIFGKFLAAFTLVLFAVLPTLIYLYTVYDLGSPRGNIDLGAVAGSYIGLLFLAACFTSIGIFSSSLSNNQIVSFLLSVFLCFIAYYAFFLISRMPFVSGTLDDIIQRIGIDYHYSSISRGVVDSRDVLYFLSFIGIFLLLTMVSLAKRKW